MGSRLVKEASACVPLSVCSFVFVLFFVCLFHRSISRRAAALRHACVTLCSAPQPSAGEAGGWPAARFSPSGVSADLCGLRRSPARRKGRGRKGLAQAGERGALWLPGVFATLSSLGGGPRCTVLLNPHAVLGVRLYPHVVGQSRGSENARVRGGALRLDPTRRSPLPSRASAGRRPAPSHRADGVPWPPSSNNVPSTPRPCRPAPRLPRPRARPPLLRTRRLLDAHLGCLLGAPSGSHAPKHTTSPASNSSLWRLRIRGLGEVVGVGRRMSWLRGLSDRQDASGDIYVAEMV